MRKTIIIGLLAAFVLAGGLAGAALAEGPVANTKNVKKQAVWDSACISKAVEKRETAIIAAHDSLSAAIKTALEKRKAALIAAWSQSDGKARREARLNAWKTFKQEHKAARQKHLSVTKEAWKTFKTEGKACKIEVNGVEPEGQDVSVSAAAANSANVQ